MIPHSTDGTSLFDSPSRLVASCAFGGGSTFLPLTRVGGACGLSLSFRTSFALMTMRLPRGVARVAARERELGVGRVRDDAVVGRVDRERLSCTRRRCTCPRTSRIWIWSPGASSSTRKNGAPCVVRWPAIAALPIWPGSGVPGIVARALGEVGELHALPEDPVDVDLLDDDLADDPALGRGDLELGVDRGGGGVRVLPGLAGFVVGAVTTGLSSAAPAASSGGTGSSAGSGPGR